MDRLDELLAESRPRVAPAATLAAVTATVMRPRQKRGFIIAGALALSLAGGTAAAATTGPLGDLIDYYLNGHPNDHAWEMDITGTDGTMHCIGGIVVLPAPEKSTYVEADYLAIKRFVEHYDWTDLEPDPSLLHSWQKGTAEQLAITADRHMIEVAVDAGYTTDSIYTQGAAECSPK